MTKQYTLHPWAEVIKAWADGKPVQYRMRNYNHLNGWIDITPTGTPGWDVTGTYEYRIKPDTKKYRLALFNNAGQVPVAVINSEQEAEMFSRYRTFVRWLTDWVEYEV